MCRVVFVGGRGASVGSGRGRYQVCFDDCGCPDPSAGIETPVPRPVVGGFGNGTNDPVSGRW